jgi:hypothetical protein
VAAIDLPIQGRETLCYWKRSRTHWLWAFLGRFGGRTYARHAWELGHAFLRRGISTPKPLAFVDRTDRQKPQEYLLTEGIPRSTNLATYLRERVSQMPMNTQRQWLHANSAQLARQLQKLHECRYDHRDLKATNILVSEDPVEAKIWLLDLDAVRRWLWLPQLRVVQNLARLNASCLLQPVVRHSDRLRFLLAYLGRRQKQEWKPLWNRIARRTTEKILRSQRVGRPLG